MHRTPVFARLSKTAHCLLALILLTASAPVAAQGDNQPGNSQAALERVSDSPFTLTDHKFIHKWLRPGEYMPVNEVKAGMEGYGLSVFQGTVPQKFNVKVIGVVRRVINGRDSILVRLSGPLIGKANVVRGMSGSPVYINGKIIGAVSYGFEFSTEPIAGLTPIADMLDALAQDTEGKTPPDRISKGSDASFTLPGSVVDSLGSVPGMAPAHVLGGAPKMVPLMSPVSLAGFSPRAQEFLSQRLRDCGLYVTSGSAGALDESLDKQPAKKLSQAGESSARELVPPGGAVSVMLSTGDFNSSACGTSTTTFGGKVLAFGHPFLQAGCVDFPMATAFIHQIMPSLSVSFKVSSPIKVIGSFLSDRPWAVSGVIGRTSKMIPATYTITDETRKVKRTFHCRIVNHPDLTPELLAATAMSAIDATHQSSGPYVLKVQSTIDAADFGRIQRTDSYSNNFAMHGMDGGRKLRMVFDPVGSYLLNTASKILDNDYQRAEIKSVNMDISLSDGHETARLERIYVDKPIVEPGETVTVSCVLRPYNKEPEVKQLSLQIPRDVPDGNLLLGVSSGDDVDIVRKRMGLIDPPADSLNQIVRKIRDAGRADSIAAVLALPEQSILVNGVKLTNPPAHWERLFFSDRYTKGASLVRGEVKTSSEQDWLVDGSHIMTVEVRRADKSAARAQFYQPTTGSPIASMDGILITDAAKKAMDLSRKPDAAGTAGASSSSSTNDSKTSTPPVQYFNPPKDYPHMRSVQLWHQEAEEDFRPGKTINTTIDSWGRVSPALQDLAKVPVASDMRIWSSTAAAGSFYYATSNRVFKWKGDSSPPEQVAKLDSVIIPALVSDSKGVVYAACVPSGKVYAIDGNGGAPRVVMSLQEPIIASLCVDDQDNLYAGTSATGKVYKMSLKGDEQKPSVLCDTGQAHVTALFFNRPESRLYVGTAEKGSVYSVDAQGKMKAEYQSSDHIVTALAKDAKGNLFVATAGQGRLIRVKPTGEVEALALSEAFYTLAYDADTDCVFAGDGEGDITQTAVDPLSSQPFFIPVCHTEQEGVLALSLDGKGHLFAGTSNLPVARSFDVAPSNKAVYLSATRDAVRTANWSRLRAYGAYNEVNEAIGKTIVVETRSGETSQPDDSWSAWQEGVFDGEAYLLKSPPGRYLQYKLSWKSAAPIADVGKTSRPVSVGRVEVTYLPKNAPPQFSSVSTKTGAAFSGKQDLSVVGNDSDGDNLLLKIEASLDGGKTWKVLAENLRSKKTAKETRPPANKTSDTMPGGKGEDNAREDSTSNGEQTVPIAGSKRNRLQIALGNARRQWLDDKREPPKDGDAKPEDSKDEAGKEAQKGSDDDKVAKEKADEKEPKTSTKEGKAVEKVKGKPTTSHYTPSSKSTDTTTAPEKITYNWDTSKVKDGSYVLRFTLDDRPSNPDQYLQNIAYRSVDVDNSPPDIKSVRCTKKDKKLQVRVEASDKQTPIANATYRLDEGELMALTGVDNITDGLNVTLGANDVTLEHGSHKLEVLITDKAGNTATKTVSVN